MSKIFNCVCDAVQVFHPLLKRSGDACIVNIGSVAGRFLKKRLYNDQTNRRVRREGDKGVSIPISFARAREREREELLCLNDLFIYVYYTNIHNVCNQVCSLFALAHHTP